MKYLLLAATSLCLGGLAFAQDSEDAAARHAACVADVIEKSAAAGEPAEDPAAVCDCLRATLGANPALVAEVTAAGGLPAPEASSPELVEAIDSCKGATSAG